MNKKSGRAAAAGGRVAAKNVEEYLAGVPEPARGTLRKVRATIRSVVPPEAVEAISYGMPSFKYKGTLLWFAAFENHCSLFPTAAGIEALKDELADFTISKGTIRFPVDRPFPPALLKKLVKARVAQNERKRRR